MAIFKAVVHSDYVQIPNEAMQDSKLTFEARGLLAMLLSMPADWEVHKSWAAKESPAGKDKVNSIFNELEQAGYIRREEGQRKFGQFASDDYFVFPNKVTVADLPLRSSRCGSTVDGESATIKETSIQNKHQQNKHSSAKAAKKLTKAELLVNKIRSEPSCYQSLNCLDDELIIEWAKLRCKKGASDSNRALSRIESTLEALRYNYEISPDQAISKQCDAGWTSIEVDYFVKGNQQQPIQQDDTSWGNNMQAAYIPNQQKALGHE